MARSTLNRRTLNNLAWLRYARKENGQADKLSHQALLLLQQHPNDTFSASSERQRLGLLAQQRAHLDGYGLMLVGGLASGTAPRHLSGGMTRSSFAVLQQELTPGKGKSRYRDLHLATHGYFEPPHGAVPLHALAALTVGVGSVPGWSGPLQSLVGPVGRRLLAVSARSPCCCPAAMRTGEARCRGGLPGSSPALLVAEACAILERQGRHPARFRLVGIPGWKSRDYRRD